MSDLSTSSAPKRTLTKPSDAPDDGRSLKFEGPDPQARVGFSPVRRMERDDFDLLADGIVVGRISLLGGPEYTT
jgi:hypothetical protein